MTFEIKISCIVDVDGDPIDICEPCEIEYNFLCDEELWAVIGDNNLVSDRAVNVRKVN